MIDTVSNFILEEPRYFVNLAVRNILRKARVDFELYRPSLDDETIIQLAEVSGYNSNHPNFDGLREQIMGSFTLHEISQFLDCLSSLKVVEVDVKPAIFRANDPKVPKKGEQYVAISIEDGNYDFSQLDGYTLPFVVMGRYNPSQTF